MAELLWKVDRTIGDLGNPVVPCSRSCSLQDGEGLLLYFPTQGSGDKALSLQELFVGSAQLSALSSSLKGWKGYGYPSVSPAEALAGIALLSLHQKRDSKGQAHSPSPCSDRVHCPSVRGYFVCPVNYFNHPCYKALNPPDFTRLPTCFLFPFHPAVLPSTKDLIKIKGHRKTGRAVCIK